VSVRDTNPNVTPARQDAWWRPPTRSRTTFSHVVKGLSMSDRAAAQRVFSAIRGSGPWSRFRCCSMAPVSRGTLGSPSDTFVASYQNVAFPFVKVGRFVRFDPIAVASWLERTR